MEDPKESQGAGKAGSAGETSPPAAAPASAGTNPPPASVAAAKPAARKPRKPRPKAIINENGCTGCEACITVCPVDCIVKIPNPETPEINPICRVDWDRCTGCTICARDCPWETIDMVLPNQPGIRVLVASYSMPEYGPRFIPEPEEESAA